MRAFCWNPLFLTFLFSLAIQRSLGIIKLARTPPRGWNSYDSFCWTVSEEEFLQNAQLVAQRLKPYGYEYVVVDYLWYRKKVEGAYVDSLGYDVIDEWGRVIPDPGRWPSSRNGKGFSEVASKVHDLGLKFGIHIMRGISTQAFNANTPILDITTGKQYEESGKKWYAKDIGMLERRCTWMKNGFMSVNTNLGAGKAFLSSLHQQYAEWGVDFVKHDCVFGEDFNPDEISFVSSFLKQSDRQIIYSLSPGTSVTPAMAANVSHLVNMYRITGDDWDKWGDVASHFDISRDVAAASLIGVRGSRGKSWPDLDMLPFGWLTDPGSNEGPHRYCSLTRDEQRTQITLWAMAKSPLMLGGDVRRLDDSTLAFITNPTILQINSISVYNKEFPYVWSTKLTQTSNHGNLNEQTNAEAPTLVLTNCDNIKARGWSAEAIDDDLEQVCWNEKLSKGNQEPFCLYKRKPLLLTDEDTIHKHYYDGRAHLLETRMSELCLSASPNQRLTSEETRTGSFFPCRWDTNQMWELNHNGTLTNSYSGLCASMRNIKVMETGVRAWVAAKRKGTTTFLAFFNLDSDEVQISSKIADLGKTIPGRNFSSCKTREVWSGKDFGEVKDMLSVHVEAHGTALFVLNCA